MMSRDGEAPVHWYTVGVMIPGFRVAVTGVYEPLMVRWSARAARSPCSPSS